MTDSMRNFAEEMEQQGIKKGEKKGEKKAKKNLAKKLFERDNSVEEIADVLDVGVKQVKKWLGLMEA